MFSSVSDIAAQRLAIPGESGRGRGTPSRGWPVVGEGAGSRCRSADGKNGAGALRTTPGQGDTGYRMEREREREREREMEKAHRNTNRVTAWEQHLARATLSPRGAVGENGSTDMKNAQSANRANGGSERTYGDIRTAPTAARIEDANSERGEYATLSADEDESLSLAVYFDEEMRLLSQVPVAARALRRELASDIAKFLGVPGERVSLIELYDGPVAEVAILKADASRTCKSLAADLSNASRTSFTYPQARLQNYVRSISAVKIRGSLSSARPLSTMLRPLADSIQERLSSIDRKVGNKDDIHGAPSSSNGMGPKHEVSMGLIDRCEAAGIIAEVTSDSDLESLGASSFTIQSGPGEEDSKSNPSTARTNEPTDLCTVLSSDSDELPADVPQDSGDLTGSRNLGCLSIPVSSPVPAEVWLEIVMAKGLPHAENAGIFPDTYACASLLYADPWSLEQLPIDHATGEEECEDSAAVDVPDVVALPFKIKPHVRTGTHPRSVNPTWNSTFSLRRTRPSFIVVDGPNYTKKLFSSQRDVPLHGQHVLVLVTVHEQQRFGAHRRMGCVVLEVKPGPPVSEWFTLYKGDGTPVPSSTGRGHASVHLRITYPGFDLTLPYKMLSPDPANPGPSAPDVTLHLPDANGSTMLAPFHLPESRSRHRPGQDATFNSYTHPEREDASRVLFRGGGDSDASHAVEGDSATYLETVARRIFNVNQSFKKSPCKKSPKQKACRATPTELPTTASPKSILHGRDGAGDRSKAYADIRNPSAVEAIDAASNGLYIERLAATRLPRRLAQGCDPRAYAAVTLVLVSEAEQELISSGHCQLRHAAPRRGQGARVKLADSHLRLDPQCRTHTHLASQSPTWDEALCIKQAVHAGTKETLTLETLHPEFTRKPQQTLAVLVSVFDAFELGSDRLLGNCAFPILPGQRLEQTLELRGSDRMFAASADDRPTASSLYVRAHLKIPPQGPHRSAITGPTNSAPTPHHREVSPSLSPSKIPTGTQPAHTWNQYSSVQSSCALDLSDSDSSTDAEPEPPYCTRTEPPGLGILSPPSSSHSDASAGSAEASFQRAFPHSPSHGKRGTAGQTLGQGPAAPAATTPIRAATNSSPQEQYGGGGEAGGGAGGGGGVERPPAQGVDQMRNVEKPSATSPSYTELEKAFMLRVAARRSQSEQSKAPDHPPGSRDAPCRSCGDADATNGHTHASGWKPTSHF